MSKSSPSVLLNKKEKFGKLRFLELALRTEVRRLQLFGQKEPIRLNELAGVIECGSAHVSVEKGYLFNVRVKLAEITREEMNAETEFTEADVHAAIEGAAVGDSYHPVEDWLRGLRWDGVDRMAEGLPVAFGQTPGSIQARFLRYSLRAMVARPLRPGCQVDTVLVLIGEQGRNKSRALRALAGEWFGDPHIEFGNKDGWEQVHRHWLIELAELAAVRKTGDIEQVKAFCTRSDDHFREPYERKARSHKRRSIFFATTNQPEFLLDSTGNRRWWPVETGAHRIDIEWLKSNREQLFAQAVAEVEAGEVWHLTFEQEAEHAALVEAHLQEDPWTEVVRDWMESPDGRLVGQRGARISEVIDVVNSDKARWGVIDQKRCAAILSKLGAVRGNGRERRTWFWGQSDAFQASR